MITGHVRRVDMGQWFGHEWRQELRDGAVPVDVVIGADALALWRDADGNFWVGHVYCGPAGLLPRPPSVWEFTRGSRR